MGPVAAPAARCGGGPVVSAQAAPVPAPLRGEHAAAGSAAAEAPRWAMGLGVPGRLRLVLGLALAVSACRPATPAGEPAAAVQRFYAAMAADDCAAALAVLGKDLRARLAPRGSCDALFHDLRQAPLERTVETHVDGRNRDAQLVRVRLRGRTTDTIIRVQAEGAEWRIFSM